MNIQATTSAILIATLPYLASGQEIDFATDIRPILSDKCYTCHGPDAEARVTTLRLDQRASAIESEVLTSGDMVERLLSSDPDE